MPQNNVNVPVSPSLFSGNVSRSGKWRGITNMETQTRYNTTTGKYSYVCLQRV